MPALLEAEQLHARYGWIEVLHGLAFTVEDGGITTILGANGAGKTTTLRAICGLVKTSGRIRFAGFRCKRSLCIGSRRHGLELPEHKLPAKIAGSLLAVEGTHAVDDANGECSNRQDRCKDNQQHHRCGYVDQSLDLKVQAAGAR